MSLRKLFIVAIALALAAAACSSDSDTDAAPEDTGAATEPADGGEDTSTVEAEAANVSPPGSFPIVSESETITIMIAQTTGVEDFETNEFTLWLEEKTGLDLEFMVVPQDDKETVLNLTLSSGDLPDVIAGFDVPPATLTRMGSDGLFLPLNDFIEVHGFETKRALDIEQPFIRQLNTSTDGNIYGLPHINQCFHCGFAQKMYIYRPWLDELGLEMPTTTDEFYDVMVAFKEQDPNGNGIADEVPLSAAIDGWHTSIDRFLLNPFVFWNRDASSDRIFLEDGQVQASFAQDGYQDGLAYLNRLYTEGLLDQNALIQDREQMRQLGNNPDEVILGAYPGGWHGQAVEFSLSKDGGRSDLYEIVPALAGPGGERTFASNPWGYSSGNWIVTSAAANPAAAFKLGDLLYSEEATIRNEFGVAGVDWDYTSSDQVGINGGPALFEKITSFEEIQNQHWNQAAITYRPSELRLSRAQSGDGSWVDETLYAGTAQGYAPYGRPLEELIPPLSFSEDDSAELVDLELALETYVDEMFVRFVTGDADLESEWDTYLSTLDNLGLARYLELYQASFDLVG